MPSAASKLPATYKRTEVAELYRVSVKTLDALVERGAVPAPVVRTGGVVRWSREQIQEALRRGEQGG